MQAMAGAMPTVHQQGQGWSGDFGAEVAADNPLPDNGLPISRERGVRAVCIVGPEPWRGEGTGLSGAFDIALVKPLMPDGADVTLGSGVFLRRDVQVGNHPLSGRFPQFATDVFGAVECWA